MRVFILWLAILFSLKVWSQGGPPMVTDDPGTPGDGHWEINIANLYSLNSAQQVLQSPYFDLNYGWGSRTQLKVETGWVNVWDHTSDNQGGAGGTLVGVKYRFVDEPDFGVAISTYPQIQFGNFFSSRDPEISPSGTQYLLPIEFEKSFASWAINPEIGFLYGTLVANELFYGVVFAYENFRPWEPLAELHFNSRFDGSGSETLLNFGSRLSLSAPLNLLAALGHTLTNTADARPELDAYLGIQLEL